MYKRQELERKIDEKINQVKRDVVGRVNPTICFYRHNKDTSNQPKFWGDGNPIQFIRDCEWGMDSVGDQLNDSDKIDWVVRRLSSSAALWYSIVRDNIKTYDEFIKCFENRYWNEHIQRKARDRLDFDRFTPGKLTHEQYVIKEIAKVKHLRPELPEAELVHK